MSKPRVSIIAITFNQEKYIKEALESFISQKTDFDFEAIVADDNSSDHTANIIHDYAERYPKIIKPIFRKKNLGSWLNFLDTLSHAKGEYIALCEGDDFWTVPDKLQKQVSFLDNNPKYALCFHPVKVFFENDAEPSFIYPDQTEKNNFTVKELLKHNFIQTNSVVYRRQDYKNMPKDIMPGDWFMHLYHAQFGEIGFINNVMSAYRRHPGGLWWHSDKDLAIIWQRHGFSHLNLYKEILKLYSGNSEYSKIVQSSIDELFNSFIEVEATNGSKLFLQAIKKYPNDINGFVGRQHKELKAKKHLLKDQDDTIKDLRAASESANQALDQLQHELRLIKASRFWKLRNKIAKLFGKTVV